MPKMTASRTRVTRPSRSPGEGGLGVLRLSDGGRRRVHRDGQTVLPLDEEACTVRLSEGIERDGSLHGLERPAVQRRDECGVVDAVRVTGGLVDYLADAVRLS